MKEFGKMLLIVILAIAAKNIIRSFLPANFQGYLA